MINFLNMAVDKLADRIGGLGGDLERRFIGTPGQEIAEATKAKPRFEPAIPGGDIQGTPQQEAQARAAGFPSYAAMVYHQRRSAEKSGGTVPGSAAPSAEAAMSWHPKNILEYVTRMMGGS